MYKPKTAPMGWNSWDCYGAAVTEDIVKQNAKFMAENLKPLRFLHSLHGSNADKAEYVHSEDKEI